jgi:hypothetical protein
MIHSSSFHATHLLRNLQQLSSHSRSLSLLQTNLTAAPPHVPTTHTILISPVNSLTLKHDMFLLTHVLSPLPPKSCNASLGSTQFQPSQILNMVFDFCRAPFRSPLCYLQLFFWGIFIIYLYLIWVWRKIWQLCLKSFFSNYRLSFLKATTVSVFHWCFKFLCPKSGFRRLLTS